MGKLETYGNDPEDEQLVSEIEVSISSVDYNGFPFTTVIMHLVGRIISKV